jgi:hypothetical protein
MAVLTRILISSHLLVSGKCSLARQSMTPMRRTGEAVPMVYSYTQISQYLRCPRSYRYRYLDDWREKETRAAMAFGRCFENALAAYFREEDCGAALFKEWEAYRDAAFEFKKGETWDRLGHQGVHLLQRFAQDDRVRVSNPRKNLQIKFLQLLAGGTEFVAYLDAIGEIDGVRCLIDWKTTTSRYPEGPEGLLSLDPQLICNSWISGIPEVHSLSLCGNMLPRFNT